MILEPGRGELGLRLDPAGEGIQVFGGNGYIRAEYMIERIWRDLLFLTHATSVGAITTRTEATRPPKSVSSASCTSPIPPRPSNSTRW